MDQRKNFIVINESFTCSYCNHKNPPLDGGCRNHCMKCLYSIHVDQDIPGDRKSSCHGLMKPYKIDYQSNKGYIIIHKCLQCGQLKRNKVSKDDDFDKVIELTTKHSNI